MSVLSTSRLDIQTPSKTKTVRFQLDYNLKSSLLEFVSDGDKNLYDELLHRIRNVGQEIRDDDLTQLLKEARSCISIIDVNFRLFVQVVLILRWAHRGDEVVEEYKGFLQELCLAHNYYTKQVIDHLVTSFKITGNDLWENGVPTNETVKCYSNIHHVVKSLLSLMPMSKEILLTSLKRNYPYMKKPSSEQEAYVYNMLQMINCIPSLRKEILKILISKLIILDTHAPRTEILESLSQMEVEQTQSATLENNDDELSISKIHPIAQSLDFSLTLIFRFIYDCCFPDGSTLDWNTTKSLFFEFIEIFENLILPTHAINHVQFLIFYIAGFKPVLGTTFLQNLWKNVLSVNEAPVIRQTCAFYIASFLSRAKYLSISIVQEMLAEMSNWSHSYLAGLEDSLCFDFRLHSIFYTICQSMFYVIAFRYKELVQGRGLIFLQGLNLSKIVTCRLNPLKACVPLVATNFASVARKYQLAYCFAIIEHNARTSLPQLRRDVTGLLHLIEEVQLDAYFPFDPYVLQRSLHYIEPNYKEYSGSINGGGNAANEQDDDENSDDDFLDSSENISTLSLPPNFN